MNNTDYDIIENLPTNTNVPSHDEIQIMDKLFYTDNSGFLNEVKKIVILAILFVIMSLPPIDELVKKLVPITQKSPYMLLIVKTLCFVSIFWFIDNFHLS